MEKPDYGGPKFHIFINFVFGITLLFIAVFGAMFIHRKRQKEMQKSKV